MRSLPEIKKNNARAVHACGDPGCIVPHPAPHKRPPRLNGPDSQRVAVEIHMTPVTQRELAEAAVLISRAIDGLERPGDLAALTSGPGLRKLLRILLDYQSTRRVLKECLGDDCAMGSHCIELLSAVLPDDQW
jgi:hypothetical protein